MIGLCANLLCDREKPCAACKLHGRTRLASAIAKRIARFDEYSFERVTFVHGEENFRAPVFREDDDADRVPAGAPRRHWGAWQMLKDRPW